jgi:hypothetical protein
MELLGIKAAAVRPGGQERKNQKADLSVAAQTGF